MSANVAHPFLYFVDNEIDQPIRSNVDACKSSACQSTC